MIILELRIVILVIKLYACSFMSRHSWHIDYRVKYSRRHSWQTSIVLTDCRHFSRLSWNSSSLSYFVNYQCHHTAITSKNIPLNFPPSSFTPGTHNLLPRKPCTKRHCMHYRSTEVKVITLIHSASHSAQLSLEDTMSQPSATSYIVYTV